MVTDRIETAAEGAEVVRRGGLLVVPTDTVYGLAARPDPESVERIFAVKQRVAGKPLQVLVAGPEWLDRLGRPTVLARRLAAAYWPGPLTLVVLAAKDAPPSCVLDEKVGLRVPDHPLALELLALTGPLAATSANPSGEATPSTVAEIEALFGDAVDGYLDGGRTGSAASTVVDVAGETPRVLREGAIPSFEIMRLERGGGFEGG